MKSHEGPRDALARYIRLKLVDLMVASHDLETHRRQNKLEIGKQRRIRSTSSPCNLPQMAGSIVVQHEPSLSSSAGSSVCSGLSFVVESSICVCTGRYDTSSNNSKPWQNNNNTNRYNVCLSAASLLMSNLKSREELLLLFSLASGASDRICATSRLCV